MAESIDPLVIKKTQDILGSVIRKPPLTEKSLKKPPFRFLHDIITNVIKTTGFLKGLYGPEELQSENVKDKESKIAFLQKAIDVLEIVSNQKIQVRPSKIVAGHEPQKTNEFLQLLGSSAKSKFDSKEAVQQIIGDRTPKRSLPHNKERKASIDKKASSSQKTPTEKTSRSSIKAVEDLKKVTTSSVSGLKEVTKSRDGDRNRNKGKEIKLKERGQSKDRKRVSKMEDSNDSIRKGTKEKSRKEVIQKEAKKIEPASVPLETSENKENGEVKLSEELIAMSTNVTQVNGLVNGNAAGHEEEMEDATDVKITTPSKDKEPILYEEPLEINEKLAKIEKLQKPPSAHVSRPPSAKSVRTQPVTPVTPLSSTSNDLNALSTTSPSFTPSSRPTSARPPSARPAPPKIRIRHIVDNEEPSINLRPPSAKPVENVILDTTQHSDDEDDAFIVSDENLKEDTEAGLVVTMSKPAPETPEEEQGSLVKQLLETKKDLEGGSQQPSSRKVEIDKSQMTDMARKRERESSGRELEQLRTFIQTLSRTANPLGRMLDYLQEDIDSMKSELKMWRGENEQNMITLRHEQSVTESVLEPLRVQLDDLELQVQDQLEANGIMKCTIVRNDERIQRMLTAINNRS